MPVIGTRRVDNECSVTSAVNEEQATAVRRSCFTVFTILRKENSVYAPARTSVVQVTNCRRGAVSSRKDRGVVLSKRGIVKGRKRFFFLLVKARAGGSE